MKRLLFVLLLAASTLHAQSQSVPVTIPGQMMPVPVKVNGLPAGCTWTATGGATIIVTVANCAVTPPPSTVTGVTVSGPASVAVGATVTFTATVQGTNSPSQAVVWSVVAGSGSITSGGLFTAPAAVGSTTIKATSVQDATKSGTLPVTVTASNVIAVGSTVQTVMPAGETVINVRATPAGTLVGTQPAGVQGTVIAGPSVANSFDWWQVTFKTGPSGWVGVDALAVVGSTPTVQINWTASPSASLVGYNVYRSTVQGGPYAPLGCATAAAKKKSKKKTASCTTVAAPTTVYVDPNVAHGMKYFYVITAVGSTAAYNPVESLFSNEASVTE